MIMLRDNKKFKHVSFRGHLVHVIWALELK